ncbi:MAG: hypothetical protein KJ941_00085 [Bacteroidetes bacterium]|nr:hypothetical protein [Bacteroidota bacterium]
MSSLNDHHQKLTNGVGKCSVPMWSGGMPAGFCDNDAYGFRPPGESWYNRHVGQQIRFDGKYGGYVPGLACPIHGGPKREEFAHEGNPCKHCNTPHDEVKIGLCPALIKES